MTPLFRPQDFGAGENDGSVQLHVYPWVIADRANQVFEKWLSAQIAIYSKPDSRMGLVSWNQAQRADESDTHRAKLVAIEPLVPEPKVNRTVGPYEYEDEPKITIGYSGIKPDVEARILGLTAEQILELRNYYEIQTRKLAKDIGKPCEHEMEVYTEAIYPKDLPSGNYTMQIPMPTKTYLRCQKCQTKLKPKDGWTEAN